MENRRVCSINCVASVYPARCQNSDRRFLLFHSSNLHRRCLCTKNHIFVYVEGVLCITCRMVLRNVKCLEIIIIKLNLRPLGYGKAHSDKYILQIVQHLCQRMLCTLFRTFTGDGNIYCFFTNFLFLNCGLKCLFGFFKLFADIVPHLIGELSHNRTFLGRKCTHSLHNSRQFAFLSKELNTKLLKRFQCMRGRKCLICHRFYLV